MPKSLAENADEDIIQNAAGLRRRYIIILLYTVRHMDASPLIELPRESLRRR